MNAIDRALYAAAQLLVRGRRADPANGISHKPWHPTARIGPYTVCRHPDCPAIVVAR